MNRTCGSIRSRFVLLSAMAVMAACKTSLGWEDARDSTAGRGSTELGFAGKYEPGKVPVVFLHGLLGSPGNWSAMIDRLAGEPALRARFQFFTFHYDSFESIPESGSRLVEALDGARHRWDPDGRDPSFEHVVLVGHSLGGLVAKATSHVLEGRRCGPRVARFVFVATPHRGAPIDRGAVHSVGNWLARNLRTRSAGGGARVSSVDQLSWEHPLLAELERARAGEGIPFHSIIAALHDPSAAGATDGVVPLASARLGGAQSEVVIRTHHLCLDQPEVIGEVRRILVEYDVRPANDRPLADNTRMAGSARGADPRSP